MHPTTPLSRSLRRAPLTTKQVNKGFYKGNRTGSMGRHTKHGGYVIEWNKVRTYVVPPELKSFKLTPFITKNMEPSKGKFDGDPKGPLSGDRYLAQWKEENGVD